MLRLNFAQIKKMSIFERINREKMYMLLDRDFEAAHERSVYALLTHALSVR
jgi:hypothetical protein